MQAKPERETVVHFEFQSKMPDVGLFNAKLKLMRRTAHIVTEIKYAKAKMLAGLQAASNADNLHFDVMATLANAVAPVPDPFPLQPAAWINEIMDPAIWYAIYERWLEYQASFEQPKEAKGGEPGQDAV